MEAVIEGLRALREHDVVEAALNSVREQAESPSAMTFCGKLISTSPDMEELWAIWHSQAAHSTTSVTIAMLAALRALLRIAVPPDQGHSPVAVALHGMAQTLLTTQLTPFYRFCSSGDHTKANHALHLLTTAASYSPTHTMHFLTNFNFTFNMLPKLAAPPRIRPPAQARGSTAITLAATPDASGHSSSRWDSPDLSKRPSRALVFKLAAEVLRSAPSGAGVAMVLRAPQLLPLICNSLSRDPPHAITTFCAILLSRVLSPGAQAGASACATLLSGKALWQLALISSGGGASAPPSNQGHGPEADSHREQCIAVANAVLLRAASSPEYGLWEPLHDNSPGRLVVTGKWPACLPLGLMESTAEAESVRSGDESLCLEQHWAELQEALLGAEGRSAGGSGRLTGLDIVRLPACCIECTPECVPGAFWVPKKALLGLTKRLRFQSSPAHLSFLVYLIRRSPVLASSVLASRDLAPHNTDGTRAALRRDIATACLQSASRAASSLHAAISQACTTKLGGVVRISKSQVAAFLSSVFPPNIAKGLMCKALQSLEPAFVQAALCIMHEQLQTVAVVSAGLRAVAGMSAASSAEVSAHSHPCDAPALRIGNVATGSFTTNPTGSHGLTPHAIEVMISQHIQAHCPEPAVLHSALSAMIETGLGVPRNPLLNNPTGPAGAATSSQAEGKTGKADEKTGGHDSSKQEAEELRVNVEGMEHDAQVQVAHEPGARHRWDKHQATAAAELLLSVVNVYQQCAPGQWSSPGASPWKVLSQFFTNSGSPHEAPAPLHRQLLHVVSTAQRLQVQCPENQKFSASWSAAHLAPVMALLARSHDGRTVALCEDIIHSTVLSLGLHSGRDDLMLPWTLMLPHAPTPQHSSPQESPTAAAVAEFVTSTYTITCRRPLEAYRPIERIVSAHAAKLQHTAPHRGTPANALRTAEDMLADASAAAVALLFSTLRAAVRRFRRSESNGAAEASDEAADAAQRLLQNEDEAVWTYLSGVARLTLPRLAFPELFAAGLLGLAVEEVAALSERIGAVGLLVEWTLAEEPLESQAAPFALTICAVQGAPAAFIRLLEWLWGVAIGHSSRAGPLEMGGMDGPAADVTQTATATWTKTKTSKKRVLPPRPVQDCSRCVELAGRSVSSFSVVCHSRPVSDIVAGQRSSPCSSAVQATLAMGGTHGPDALLAPTIAEGLAAFGVAKDGLNTSELRVQDQAGLMWLLVLLSKAMSSSGSRGSCILSQAACIEAQQGVSRCCKELPDVHLELLEGFCKAVWRKALVHPEVCLGSRPREGTTETPQQHHKKKRRTSSLAAAAGIPATACCLHTCAVSAAAAVVAESLGRAQLQKRKVFCSEGTLAGNEGLSGFLGELTSRPDAVLPNFSKWQQMSLAALLICAEQEASPQAARTSFANRQHAGTCPEPPAAGDGALVPTSAHEIAIFLSAAAAESTSEHDLTAANAQTLPLLTAARQVMSVNAEAAPQLLVRAAQASLVSLELPSLLSALRSSLDSAGSASATSSQTCNAAARALVLADAVIRSRTTRQANAQQAIAQEENALVQQAFDLACSVLSQADASPAKPHAAAFVCSLLGTVQSLSASLKRMHVAAVEALLAAEGYQFVEAAINGSQAAQEALLPTATLSIATSSSNALAAANMLHKKHKHHREAHPGAMVSGPALLAGCVARAHAAVLLAALAPQEQDTELGVMAKQMASSVRPHVLRALVKTSAREDPMGMDWQGLGRLALLCLQFQPLQSHKTTAFFRNMMPASGWDLLEHANVDGPPRHIQFSQAHCRLTVSALTLCSVAKSCDLAPVGRDAAYMWSTLETLVEPAGSPSYVLGLCLQQLKCCLHTVSRTLRSWKTGAAERGVPEQSKRPARQRGPCRANAAQSSRAGISGDQAAREEPHSIVLALVQPFLDVIDTQVGDIIAVLPDAAVPLNQYAEIAAAAVQHTSAAASAVDGPLAQLMIKSSRRLWAALLREADPHKPCSEVPERSPHCCGTATSSSDDGGGIEAAEPPSPYPAGEEARLKNAALYSQSSGEETDTSEDVADDDAQGNREKEKPGKAAEKTDLSDEDSSCVQSEPSDSTSSLTGGEDAIAASHGAQRQSTKGQRASHEHQGGADEAPVQSSGEQVRNLKVAEAALQALSAIASSDKAMCVIFDAEAIAARFALPQAVASEPLPLQSIALLGRYAADQPSQRSQGAEAALQQDASTQTPGHQPASAVRTELLNLTETLVACACSHVGPATGTEEGNAVVAQLLSAAHMLLPQLLSTYHATMHAEDRACSLALRALDAVVAAFDDTPRSAPDQDGDMGAAQVASGDHTGINVCKGFLASVGFAWGRLWDHMGQASSINAETVASLLSRPDIIDPRRMALAALHFPEARTLGMSEQDPFFGSPALAQAPHAAFAAYDPAMAVPAAAAMLRCGWLDAAAVVRGGWLPLLLRCLACEDAPLRIHAYDSLSLLFDSLPPAKSTDEHAPSSLREAAQVKSLLQLARNSTQEPFQKLPQASAVFLAEAAAAALNPAAFLFGPVNAFLLKRAALPRHGLAMFTQLHDGLTRDWRHRRTHARALAQAALQACAPRVKLAAVAAASPEDTSATRAFLLAAAASAALPAACAHMLRRGTLNHVAASSAAAVASALSHASNPSTLLTAVASEGSTAHTGNALLALDVLITAAKAEQLWRGEAWPNAVATFTGALWGVLGALRICGRSPCSPTAATVAPRGSLLLQEVLGKLLELAHVYLVKARAWHHTRAHPCGLELRFWQQVVNLADTATSTCHGHVSDSAEANSQDLFSRIRECLLCSSLVGIYEIGSRLPSCWQADLRSESGLTLLGKVWGVPHSLPATADRRSVAAPGLPSSTEPYAVRLLAWLVAGMLQKWSEEAHARGSSARRVSQALKLPAAIARDTQEGLLRGLLDTSSARGTYFPSPRLHAYIMQLYRIAGVMIMAVHATQAQGGVRSMYSIGAQMQGAEVKLTPQLLRALSGALGAVAAGQERLGDIMSQAVKSAQSSQSDPGSGRHKPGQQRDDINMASVLDAVEYSMDQADGAETV